MKENTAAAIQAGKTSLGIELGSTRIKAVLIDETHAPVASGSCDWENQLVDGVWTYSLGDIHAGLQACYAALKREVSDKYGVTLQTVGAIGISAMMHGYMVFDDAGVLLTSFRTWRNTTTAEASEQLVQLFGYPIPHRWSISHLYQAILNGEAHVPDIRYMTTLAGYIHWQLTGQKSVGVGDASGIFPIDTVTGGFNARMVRQFNALVAERQLPWQLEDILPRVLMAGEPAGCLTKEGARLLDPTGGLAAGIPLCPAEGDAGTGMVATNSVAPRTGNVSAGTSVFAMVVLDMPLARVHPEIDLVTTPSADTVAMVHCNNCTSEIDAWYGIFKELADTLGASVEKPQLYDLLYGKALAGEADCGGLLVYNYHSGESITGLHEGRPLLVRQPNSSFTLANLMRAQVYAALATLKIGMDILLEEERVKLEEIHAHGGLFKTPGVGQQLLAAAINTPVTVNEAAGEGGPWGMALLAAYMRCRVPGETLAAYLQQRVFGAAAGATLRPNPQDVAGFARYTQRYAAGLEIERAAVKHYPG